jgi:hypothetical protein
VVKSLEYQLNSSKPFEIQDALKWRDEILNSDYEDSTVRINQIVGILRERYLGWACSMEDSSQISFGDDNLKEMGRFFNDIFQSHEYAKGPVGSHVKQIQSWLQSPEDSTIPEVSCISLSFIFMEFTRSFGYNPQVFGRSPDSHMQLAFTSDMPGKILKMEFIFPEGSSRCDYAPPLLLKTEILVGALDQQIVQGEGLVSKVLSPMPNYSLPEIQRIYDSFSLIRRLFRRQFDSGLGSKREEFNFLRVCVEVELVNWLTANGRKPTLEKSFWKWVMNDNKDNEAMYEQLREYYLMHLSSPSTSTS